jgi:hypothetical protein
MQDKRKLQVLLWVVIALLLGVVLVLAHMLKGQRGAPPQNTAVLSNLAAPRPAASPAQDLAPAAPEALNEAVATPQEPAAGPNLDSVEQDVVAAARMWKPGLNYEVDGHSRDWTEVSVYAGDKVGSKQRLVTFRWESGGFQFASDRPGPDAASPAPVRKAAAPAKAAPALTEKDLAGVPEEFRPSQAVALEAALTGHADWAGKTRSHSTDWAQATLVVGPSHAQPELEIGVTWNVKGQYYDITSRKVLKAN